MQRIAHFLRWTAKRFWCRSYRWAVFYVPNRYHLPFMLNARGLFGDGAEVGVSRGDFSEHLLRYWRGRKLYSIDPWQEFPPDEYHDVANVSQGVQDENHRETVERLHVYGARSEIIRSTSAQAALCFRDGQLDVVYLDAQHHHEAVTQDLALWYPKVRKGGVLAGHDYVNGQMQQGAFGVKSAVDEFARERGLKLMISAEKDWPSWFVFIP